MGKFVDIEILEVLTNSLRGKLVRTEDEMGLRIAESPESVIARTRKESDLGVGVYQYIIPLACYCGRPCFPLFFPPYPSQCLRLYPGA